MPFTPPSMINASTQRSLYLSQLGAGEARKVLPYLQRLRAYLKDRIERAGDDTINARRLNKLIADVNKNTAAILGEYTGELEDDFKDLAANELAFSKQLLDTTVDDFESTLPALSQVIAAANTAENIAVNQATGGRTSKLGAWLKNYSKVEAKRVTDAITLGYAVGETPTQIARSITGTRRNGYKDGILNITRANAATMAKTGVTEMSVQAKESFNKENSDIVNGYRIIATLDGLTSDKCKGFDQQVFMYNDSYNPHPPFHPNCRSTETAVLDARFKYDRSGAKRPSVGEDGAEQVAATTSYYQWLKTQPADFQNDALGRQKALIFRNSGLSTEEFRKASRNKLGDPLTVDQMAAKNEQIMSYLDRVQ